jgi:adenylate kinase
MSMLTKLRTALDLAIWLEVSEETVRDRITGRLQCGECGFTTSSSSAQFANRPVCPYCDGRLERRNDDDPGVLQTRLQEFHTKTEPLGTFYKKVSILHRIDGNRDRDAVFADISKLIEDKTAK